MAAFAAHPRHGRLLGIALAKFLFHLYINHRYGNFRDEFDYIACGNHLAWGYVDQPPLIPFLIHLCQAVFVHNWYYSGYVITGDPNRVGRVYIASNGRGIIYGDGTP